MEIARQGPSIRWQSRAGPLCPSLAADFLQCARGLSIKAIRQLKENAIKKQKIPLPTPLTEVQLAHFRQFRSRLLEASRDFHQADPDLADSLPPKFNAAIIELIDVLNNIMVPDHRRVSHFYWQLFDLIGEHRDVLPPVVQSAMDAATHVVDAYRCQSVRDTSEALKSWSSIMKTAQNVA